MVSQYIRPDLPAILREVMKVCHETIGLRGHVRNYLDLNVEVDI
jgi:hypothetical protein